MPLKYFSDKLGDNILLPDSFSTHGDFLTTIVGVLPHPAHVKETNTTKYIIGNKANAVFLGFESADQIIGHTFRDLSSLIHPVWEKNYARIIENLDYKVKVEKKLIKDNRAIVVASGLLRMQTLIKIPILGALKKPIAIFTLNFETIEKSNLFYLFSLYKKFYPVKKIAISYFLKHLKIDTYFDPQLTEAEILVLLAMRDDSLHKVVSKKLGIEAKTVEIHCSNLRKKLKNKSLNCVLSDLRNAGGVI